MKMCTNRNENAFIVLTSISAIRFKVMWKSINYRELISFIDIFVPLQIFSIFMFLYFIRKIYMFQYTSFIMNKINKCEFIQPLSLKSKTKKQTQCVCACVFMHLCYYLLHKTNSFMMMMALFGLFCFLHPPLPPGNLAKQTKYGALNDLLHTAMVSLILYKTHGIFVSMQIIIYEIL